MTEGGVRHSEQLHCEESGLSNLLPRDHRTCQWNRQPAMNASAMELATGRTRRIGIILNNPDLFGSGDMYYSEVLGGITRGALTRNYNLLLHCAHQPNWRMLYDEILGGAADGILLTGAYMS